MDHLPQVSENVCAAVREELRSSEGNEYVARLLERLERENPNLARFIASFALQQGNAVAVSTAALLVYRLLESQLEADQLDRRYFGEAGAERPSGGDPPAP